MSKTERYIPWPYKPSHRNFNCTRKYQKFEYGGNERNGDSFVPYI